MQRYCCCIGRCLVGVQVAQLAGVDSRRLPVLQSLGLSVVGEHQRAAVRSARGTPPAALLSDERPKAGDRSAADRDQQAHPAAADGRQPAVAQLCAVRLMIDSAFKLVQK